MMTMTMKIGRFVQRLLIDKTRAAAPVGQKPDPPPAPPARIPPAVTEPARTVESTLVTGTLKNEHRQFCNDALKTLVDTFPIANDPKTHLAVFIFKQYPDGSETVGYGTTASVAGLRDRMKLWSSQDPPKPTVVPHITPIVTPGTRIH